MDWFGGLDLRPAPLVASFFGAMAYAVVLKVRSPARMASIVVVGVGVSLFIGPLLADQLQRLGFDHVSPDALQNAAGFVSGLGGMAICNGILALVKKLSNRVGTDAKGAE